MDYSCAMPITSFQGKTLTGTKEKSEQELKTKNYLKDLYIKQKSQQDTPIMGPYGFQAFDEPLDDKTVEEINTTHKLPEGYTMTFTPKTITHVFQNGMYMGDDVTPPTFNLVKLDDSLPTKIILGNKKHSNTLPEGFKVVNQNGKTYIVSEKETEEGLDKKIKTLKIADIAKKGLLVALVAVLGISIAKSSPKINELISKFIKH